MENKWLCFVFGVCAFSLLNEISPANLITPVYQWGHLEFDYPNEGAREHAISTDEFIPTNAAPIDVDVLYTKNTNKVFVTIPRFQNGIPATLGTITNRSFKGNPIIAPFPSWSWHRNPNACGRDRLVSVFRIKIDECNRLWVLDTGHIGDDRVCAGQLLAFDLQTNQLIDRYEIPENQMQSNSILVTPIVDVRDPHYCQNTFVYIADCQAFALIVYDMQQHTSWRIIDKTMYPNPFFGTYTIEHRHFELMDGILGMDLSPYKPGTDRILYFHAMSSGTEQWVYTSHIRNRTMFMNDPTPAPEIFHVYSGHRHSQVPAMAIDKNGIAYFGLASDTSINCWNTAVEYGNDNIGVLAQDRITLQFPSGVKVITNNSGEQQLWFVTMRFQRMATGSLDTTDTNFRILAAKIDDLTKGSKCLSRPSSQHHHHHHSHQYGHTHSHGGGYGSAKSTKREIDSSVHFPSD